MSAAPERLFFDSGYSAGCGSFDLEGTLSAWLGEGAALGPEMFGWSAAQQLLIKPSNALREEGVEAFAVLTEAAGLADPDAGGASNGLFLLVAVSRPAVRPWFGGLGELSCGLMSW